ncbi:MAG: YbaB/EbfC family nucleoid-associated protein [Firmicutes bacterium]|nr:YbaB/EbfC family nucleoid-associated protein [Bacillota bacterium]HXL03496.1 YbaB/EbfC family nucleoid-associated protein [Bacillota bacterium]
MANNMGRMLKQVQKMQADLARIQEELKEKTMEGTAGGGVVRVTINGHQEILAIKIAPEVVDPDDVEMLQDLIIAAVNDALRKCQDMASKEMGKVTGGLNIPGLPSMF